MPYGCVIRAGSVACVARGFLRDRTYMQAEGEAESLLPESEVPGLDLRLLTTDSAALVHDEIREDLCDAVWDGELVLELESLRSHAPELTDVALVKAIGRLLPCVVEAVPFLFAILKDESRPAEVRLAAASGGGSVEAVGALEPLESFFTEHAAAEVLEIARGIAAWKESRRDTPDAEREAFRRGDVAAWERIWGAAHYAASYPEEAPPPTLRPALLAVAARLDEWGREWDTWSEVPWLLDDLLVRYPQQMETILGPKGLEQVRERVRKACAAD
jgi:hypothetical protein